MTPFHDLTNTRLEIGVTGAGLPNLVLNPSGKLGAWFWVTPVANTVMQVVTGALKFTTTVSQAAFWNSDYMPVAAGRWVATRFDTTNGTASHTVRVRYEWYNAAKALLSSSVQTAGIGVTAQTNYVAAIQAPASTAYVKIRFDFYNGTGTTNPAAGANYSMKNVMVTHAATNSFGTVRTNLFPNPSIETNATGYTLTGWAGGTTPTLARSNTLAQVGSWSLRVQANAAGTNQVAVFATDLINITGGSDYVAQFKVRAGSNARNIRATLSFTDNVGSTKNSVNTLTADASGTWTTITLAGTAAAAATKARLTIQVEVANAAHFMAANEAHYFDAFHLEKATTPGSYFDGATAGGGSLSYAWSGTAHASTSTETNTAFSYADPVTWQNILGPTHEISIVTDEMQPSTLTAVILDAALDPAVVNIIRPGAPVRLITSVTAGVWDTVYEGTTAKGTSAYVLDKKPGGLLRTRITLTANNNHTTAANKPETRGVGNVSELPMLFEGKGIPWNCNGSGNQTTNNTAYYNRAGGKLLDQIGITRDTNLGYAWVDRFNVFQVWDSTNISTTTKQTFSDAGGGLSYTDIDVGYDTDDVINSLTIKYLRQTLGSGETVEVPYGPYVDQPSIDEWGPSETSEFTITGSENPANFQTFATSVLNANKTPAVTCRGLRMPVRNATEMAAATTLDLYDVVEVTFSTKLTSDKVRVTGKTHTITPDKWVVDYRFGKYTRARRPVVSMQRSTGNVTTNPTDVTDGTWITPTLGNGWVNFGGSDRSVQYMRKNGIVYIVGSGKNGTINTAAFTLPVGYRPSGIVRGATDANNAFGELAVLGSGNVVPAVGSTTRFSFLISFPAEQ